MACALRVSWIPQILETTQRQRSRASDVVPNTSFIGSADVDEVILSGNVYFLQEPVRVHYSFRR